MADILAFNFTQTDAHAPRVMNSPDLSTKLKYVHLVSPPSIRCRLLMILHSFADFFFFFFFRRLMGVDVASFGDFFVDKRLSSGNTQDVSLVVAGSPSQESANSKGQPAIHITAEEHKDTLKSAMPKATGATVASNRSRRKDGAIHCLVYKDPFSSTYKKYIFTADGKYLLGGMMIGDVSDYVKLVAIIKKKVPSLP
jgi:nitrite reductase (NAD(P)H)